MHKNCRSESRTGTLLLQVVNIMIHYRSFTSFSVKRILRLCNIYSRGSFCISRKRGTAKGTRSFFKLSGARYSLRYVSDQCRLLGTAHARCQLVALVAVEIEGKASEARDMVEDARERLEEDRERACLGRRNVLSSMNSCKQPGRDG
jgi:hypothetical protein